MNRVLEGSDGFLAGLGLTRQDGVYRIDADLPDEVAIFCHGGVIVTWLGRLLHIPTALAWSGFFLPPPRSPRSGSSSAPRSSWCLG